MQIKLFIDEDPQSVELQVNEWLRSGGITVHHMAQSQSEKNGKFVFVISVCYTKDA